MKSPTLFLVTFSLLWSAGVLFFDYTMANSLYNHWLSQSFVETTGKILTTRITMIHTNETISYTGLVSYEYDFEGARHESPEVGFGRISSSSEKDSERLRKEFPRGTPIQVFVNPNKAAQSFLYKGFDDDSWVMGMFLTPFNVAMIFLWYGVAASRRPPRPIGGAEVRSDDGQIKVRWATMPPSLLGMAAFAGIVFLGTFAVLFLKGTASSSTLPLIACLLGLGTGVYSWLNLRRRNALTHPDLILDPKSGTISLIKAFDFQKKQPKLNLSLSKARGSSKDIRLENVQSVRVIERVTTDREGNTSRTPVVLFQYLDDQGATSDLDLNSWTSRDEAELFARWLRETLVLPDATAPLHG